MGRTASLCRGAVRVADKTVNWAVLLAVLAVAAIGGYALWDSDVVHAAGSAQRYQEHRPAQDGSTGGFAQLQAKNPEVAAWLTVYGTNIDFPVTQGPDNMKYVNTDAMGEYAASGSVFLDASNAASFTDFNSILYGHHMEKRAMFGDLSEFADAEFFASRTSGTLYVGGEWRGLEFFAFLKADAGAPAVFTPAVEGDSARQEYLDGILGGAIHFRDIGVSTADQFLLLTTCSADQTNGRDILVARITAEPVPDPFVVAPPAPTASWWAQAPLWARCALIGTPLAALIWFVIARTRRRAAARAAGAGVSLVLLVGLVLGGPAQTASAAGMVDGADRAGHGAFATAGKAFPVNQEFSDLGKAAPEDDFAYELTPVDVPGGPAIEATLSGTQQRSIEVIAVPAGGSARYELRCVTPDQPGYVIDRRVYSVEVIADAAGATYVVVRNPDGEKTAAPTFEHYYGLGLGPWPAAQAEAMVESRVVVNVSGDPDQDALFAFELHSAGVVQPDAQSLRQVTGAAAPKRLEIIGEGDGSFDPWTYTAPGIYRHTIEQVNLGHANYTYDFEVYTVTDLVGRAGGELIATRTITDSGGASVNHLSFTNIYSRPSGPTDPPVSPTPSPSGSGRLPFTGATSLPVLGLAGLSLALGLVCLLARRRRAREES
ncbi:MAG: sortase [Bifidobacteriaceae bacterium]|jgi:sortase B|nr:sortase [Bifidobacteriaceae bacterium]